jgi:hypothetical protein
MLVLGAGNGNPAPGVTSSSACSFTGVATTSGLELASLEDEDELDEEEELILLRRPALFRRGCSSSLESDEESPLLGCSTNRLGPGPGLSPSLMLDIPRLRLYDEWHGTEPVELSEEVDGAVVTSASAPLSALATGD